MDVGTFLTDILHDVIKYVLAGTVVVLVAYWLFWKRYDRHVFQLKMLDMKRDTRKEILPLRLQAYERIVLFIERMNPSNMVVRLHEPGLSAGDFQRILLSEIRAEYQHNITQQLYVSDSAWAIVRQLKENTVSLIRNAAMGLPPQASAKELSAVILHHLAEQEDNPYHLALQMIKSELSE